MSMPPGVNPTAVKYIYHIISYQTIIFVYLCLTYLSTCQGNPPRCIEPEGSFPCLQQYTTGPYSDVEEFTTYILFQCGSYSLLTVLSLCATLSIMDSFSKNVYWKRLSISHLSSAKDRYVNVVDVYL
jgi:hypothetical protein